MADVISSSIREAGCSKAQHTIFWSSKVISASPRFPHTSEAGLWNGSSPKAGDCCFAERVVLIGGLVDL